MTGPGPENPRAVLRGLEQRARKRFGQHFLAKRSIVDRMVRGARLEPGTRVVEIGPGLGILTEALIRAGHPVTAVEVDDDLAARMKEVYPDVTVVHADALLVDWAEICRDPGPWAVIANLPYNVGTTMVMNLVRAAPRFGPVVVMLQAEVVARLAGVPGNKTYGALSVEIQARADVRALFGVPPTAFVPPPRVNSTIVRVDPHPVPDLGGVTSAQFDRVVRAAFAQRRKTIRNSLASLFGRDRAQAALAVAGIDPGVRAEDVALDAYRALAGAMYAPADD